MSSTEFVKFLTHAYPEYEGRLLFGIGDLARMYTNGNTQRMRAHIYEYAIPWYIIDDGHKAYNILEVQETIELTRFKESARNG